MAARDIMPFQSELGGHTRSLAFEMGGGTTSDTEDTRWFEGEVLVVDAAVGDINPEVDGTVDPSGGLHYIAAAPSAGLLSVNGGTSGAANHNILVPVFDFYGSSEFVTRNVFNNSDTNVGPGGTGAMTGVLIGVTADLWVSDAADPHTHGLDINGDFFVITRILNTLGQDTLVYGGTADKVVFRRNI